MWKFLFGKVIVYTTSLKTSKFTSTWAKLAVCGLPQYSESTVCFRLHVLSLYLWRDKDDTWPTAWTLYRRESSCPLLLWCDLVRDAWNSTKLMVCALLEPRIQSWKGGECSLHLSLLHLNLLIPLNFPIPFPETMQNWTGTKYAEFKISTLSSR